ncbi:mCG1046423, partial [Mus musculus]
EACGSARGEFCMVQRLGRICSLSFYKDARHSPSLPKAVPGTHMMVSSTTLGFDDSLEGLSGSSKAVVFTDMVCTAKGYRLIGMNESAS